VVTGVDISPELLTAAGDLSGHIRPPIEFRLADTEQLPFDDGAFDGVISTFGVMFAINQEAAAAELGRVCRSGGRLVLATWAPAGAAAEFALETMPLIESRPINLPRRSSGMRAKGSPGKMTTLLSTRPTKRAKLSLKRSPTSSHMHRHTLPAVR
jgi:SAM-dependent methyltransferase